MWQETLNGFLKEVLAIAVATFIPVVCLFLGKILGTLLKKIKNEVARKLAYDAVLWAKNKFSGDGMGDIKLSAAVDFLSKKTGISRERAEVLVRAAYENLFVESLPPATSNPTQ